MFNVGGPEVLVILLVALIALGPAQLPQAARKVGQVMTEIRRVSSSFQRELQTAFEVEEQKEKAKDKPVSAGGPTDRSKNRTEPRTNGTAPVDDEPTTGPEPDEPPAADPSTEATSGDTARSDT